MTNEKYSGAYVLSGTYIFDDREVPQTGIIQVDIFGKLKGFIADGESSCSHSIDGTLLRDKNGMALSFLKMPIDDMHMPINYSLKKSDKNKADIEGMYKGEFKLIGGTPIKFGRGYQSGGIEEAIMIRETEKSNVAYLEVRKLARYAQICNAKRFKS